MGNGSTIIALCVATIALIALTRFNLPAGSSRGIALKLSLLVGVAAAALMAIALSHEPLIGGSGFVAP